ncbi:hypothetical protein M378DRAFT_573461 [Amanita muscaria Koide BX008]|uniref:Uncharacterized protein n=1 Tax=Amanita muscaria (strain Koide BX008) TaxID=946122 RepID=A0A0C2X7L1_AMAMK|nr:hypothetical protein M378DRAFT_573461 [Amanita muscaria Koide BX008]
MFGVVGASVDQPRVIAATRGDQNFPCLSQSNLLLVPVQFFFCGACWTRVCRRSQKDRRWTSMDRYRLPPTPDAGNCVYACHLVVVWTQKDLLASRYGCWVLCSTYTLVNKPLGL